MYYLMSTFHLYGERETERAVHPLEQGSKKCYLGGYPKQE